MFTLRKLKSSRVIFLSRLLGSSMGMLLARIGAGMDGEELSGRPFSAGGPCDRRLICRVTMISFMEQHEPGTKVYKVGRL